MRRIVIAVWAALGMPLLVLCSSCSTSSGPLGLELRSVTRLETDRLRYTAMPDFKAFAIAGNPSAVFVSGIAYDQPNADAAIATALAYCNVRRSDRSIASPCRLYAVGNAFEDPVVVGFQAAADRW